MYTKGVSPCILLPKTVKNYNVTIGLIILGILAVMLFFGAAEKYFDRLGLTSWLTFLLLLALIIGAVVPEIKTEGVVITVGGFIVPTVVAVIVLVFAVKSGEAVRTVIAILVTAAVTAMFRVLMGTETSGAVITFSLLVGFVGGAAAYLSAGSRLGTIAGAIGGCVIGDTVTAAIIGGMNGGAMTIGGYGIFDGMIIAAAFGLIMAETVAAVRRAAENKRIKEKSLNAEAGEDEGDGIMFNASEAEARDFLDATEEEKK